MRACSVNRHVHFLNKVASIIIGIIVSSSSETTTVTKVFRFKGTPEERAYIKHFGNDPFEYNGWEALKKRYYDIEPKLLRLSEKAHQEAGYGEAVNVDTVSLNRWTLLFDNEDFRPRKIDVITYTVEDKRASDVNRTSKNYWYITEGVRKDCVFYLDLVNARRREFKLQKQVCRLYQDFKPV